LHRPLYASGGVDSTSKAYRKAWAPILEDPSNDVTMVLTGHQHYYERMVVFCRSGLDCCCLVGCLLAFFCLVMCVWCIITMNHLLTPLLSSPLSTPSPPRSAPSVVACVQRRHQFT
jgi:hypothetical protein